MFATLLAVTMSASTAQIPELKVTEVLVLTTPTQLTVQLQSRTDVSIQNLGPNPIYCAGTSAEAVVNKAHRLDALGGANNLWEFAARRQVTIWCVAATANQVTGAATIFSELKP
jgi:hypothetical protein